MKKKHELIERIKKQAAADAQRKNKARINWLCTLISLIATAILFFTINWSEITNLEEMSGLEKRIVFTVAIPAASLTIGLILRLTLGDLALYFIGRRARKSRKYFLPLIKTALLDFDNLKKSNEMAKLFALFQAEIMFWQNIVLKHALIAGSFNFRTYYWQKSLQFKFAELKHLFSKNLSCQGEKAPVINYYPYFTSRIEIFFLFSDPGLNGSWEEMALLRKCFEAQEHKAKRELNEWLDRNITVILLAIIFNFGEAEIRKPIWQEFVDGGRTFNFDTNR